MSIELEIVPDEDMPNPREDDNVGTMVCFSRRHNLGDEGHGYRHGDYDSWDELEAAIYENEDPAVCLPLYVYEHGNITMQTGPFSCPWDSGQVGFIFVSKEKARYEYGELTPETLATIKRVLEAEVKTYAAYISGECYGWTLYDTDAETVIDSGYGFYDYQDAEKEGEAALAEALRAR